MLICSLNIHKLRVKHNFSAKSKIRQTWLPHYLLKFSYICDYAHATDGALINQNSAPLLQFNYRLLREGLIREEIRDRFVEFHYQEFPLLYLFI